MVLRYRLDRPFDPWSRSYVESASRFQLFAATLRHAEAAADEGVPPHHTTAALRRAEATADEVVRGNALDTSSAASIRWPSFESAVALGSLNQEPFRVDHAAGVEPSGTSVDNLAIDNVLAGGPDEDDTASIVTVNKETPPSMPQRRPRGGRKNKTKGES